MDLELSGRVAIVTGGSRGIGKAIALELAREGVDVVLGGRQRDALEAAARELHGLTGRRVVPLVVDTGDGASVQAMVDAAAAALGRIDILVNCAAMRGGTVRGELASAREEDLLADINVKVMGYFRCAKAVAPHMQQRGWGRIINIGGMSGAMFTNISGLRNVAVEHLTKSLSLQLGAFGATVNMIHPSSTRTEDTKAEQIERAARQTIIGRIVDAREIGYLVTFLASAKAAAITGAIIEATGGFTPAYRHPGNAA